MIAEMTTQHVFYWLVERYLLFIIVNTEQRRDVVASSVVEGQLERCKTPDVLLRADLDLG